MKRFKHFEVEGRMTMDRARKTWDKVLKKDLETKGIDRQVARNCSLVNCYQVANTDSGKYKIHFSKQ